MGNPWDNDPVTGGDEPWKNDPTATDKQPVTYNSTGNPLGGGVDMAAGALAGLAKTGVGIYDFAKKLTDVKTPYGTAETLPSSAKAHALIEKYAPTTLPGKVGQYGEQAAEFAIPGGAAEEAMKGVSLLPRIAAQAGIGAGVSAAQSGGDPASIAMGAAGGAAGPLLGGLPGKTVFFRTLRNVNNPTEEAALKQAASGMDSTGKQIAPPVRMTPWQRTGARGTEKAARNLTDMPGSVADKAADFYSGAQSDLTAQGSRIADINPTGEYGPNPLPLDDLGAGQAVEAGLQARIKKYKDAADKLYASIRKDTAGNTRSVPTGQLDANGNPEIAMMESPVYLTPIRDQLQSVYEDISNGFTPEKKQVSKAYTALKNFMETPKSFMPAMDFDKFLGALKSVTRDGQAGELSDQSARLATQVIQAGEQGLDTALSGAGPNTTAKLKQAREAVKDYHATNDFLQDVRVRPNEPYEPAPMYRSFVRPKDASVAALRELQNRAPETIPVIAQTKLQSLFDRAAQNGGFSKSQGVRSEWMNLGPNTKQLLYGPEKTLALDKFFHAAEMLTPAEGSPTAGRIAAITSYGDVGLALGEFLRGASSGTLQGAGSGAAAAAGILGTTRGLPAILAKLSFKPAGAELLTQALRLPTDSPAFAQTMQTLTAMAQAGVTKRAQNPPNQRTSYAPPGTEGAIVNKYQQGGGILAPPPPPPGIGAPTQ